MSSSLYPFTATDGMSSPPNYMYFPLQGLPFLREYEVVRTAFLTSIGFSGLAGKAEALALAEKLTSMSARSDETRATAIALAAAAAALLRGSSSVSAESRDLLERMVRKFEVTKKIYPSYEPGFRKGLGEPRQLEAYYAFGLLLCAGTHSNPSLRYLNALLKLNDILVSLGAAPHDPAFAGFLVRSELELVRSLESEKGVKP